MGTASNHSQGSSQCLRGEARATKTRQFVFLSMIYRVLGLTAALLGYIALDSVFVRPAVVTMAAAFVALSAVMTALSFGRRWGEPDASRVLLAIDCALILTLNLVSAHLVTVRQLFMSSEDPFSVAVIAAAALWTFIFGSRIGIFIVCAFVPTQVAMAYLNGLSITSINWPALSSRAVWVALGGFAGLGVRTVSNRVEQLVQQAAERDGEMLAVYKMHDRALQVLSVIISATDPSDEPKERLASVGALARGLKDYILSWHQPNGRNGDDLLHEGLRKIIWDCESGSAISFFVVADHPRHSALSEHAVDAMLEAVRAACWNIVHHSEATTATVKCTETGRGVVITVYDDGVGFDLETPKEGIHLGVNAIYAAMANAGGSADLETSSSVGTMWTLRSPYGQADALVVR